MTKDDMPKVDWNDKSIVKMHKKFYIKIGDLTKEVDDILSQNCYLCVKAIEKQNKEDFDIYADFIRSTIQSDKNLQKKLGRKIAKELFTTFKNYTKEIRLYNKQKRKERWENIKKKFGMK